MDVRFSVLITVYNKEKYLKKCINSIVNQKYKCFDVIIVDDGSTDKSSDIIKKYTSKYSNIRYIYQENKGVASARNECIKHVETDYFIFVDADDYIDKNLLYKLNKEISKDLDFDILSFNMTEVDETNNVIKVLEKKSFEKCSGEKALMNYVVNDNYVYFDTPWGYVYNTKFWRKNNFKYEEGKVHEDSLMTPMIILSANKVISTKIQGYFYVQSSDSITRCLEASLVEKRLDDLFNNYKILIDFIKSIKIQKDSERYILKYIGFCLLRIPEDLKLKNKKIYFKKMKKIEFYKLIHNKTNKILPKISKVIAFINIRLFYYLFKWFNNKSIIII